jgi:TPR repeat protein
MTPNPYRFASRPLPGWWSLGIRAALLIGILVAWSDPTFLTAAAAVNPAPQPPSSAPVRGNNDDQAAVSIGRACDSGDRISCRNLGLMCAGGRGVTRNEARAVQLYQRACDLGELLGCTNLELMYELARGVAKDEARAFALYRRMCDDSTTVGCVNLGRMYEFGRGVEKDESRARGLYERLCDGSR